MNKVLGSVIALLLASFSGPILAFPATPCVTPTATCNTSIAIGVNATTGHLLSARAIFQVTGSQLTVTLSNISGDDTTTPNDVLTALFFNLKDQQGSLVSLAPSSAVLDPGSHVWNNGFPEADPAGDVIGGEWAYQQGMASAPDGFTQGISSSGLGGVFGSPNFPGAHLQLPANLNGVEYGILSAGDNPATANGGIILQDLIKDTAVFKLDISLAAGHTLDLSKPGAINLAFQYGTDTSETRLRVPLPATIPLLGVALLCMMGVVTRRRFRA